MKELAHNIMGIILFFFMLVSLCPQTSLAAETQAGDSLLLTGFVRSIDGSNGIISLDITTEGCRGLRAFKVPDDSKGDLDSSLIGQRLQFLIDSSKCERGRIYSIIFKEQP
jgi:hypothetical protein